LFISLLGLGKEVTGLILAGCLGDAPGQNKVPVTILPPEVAHSCGFNSLTFPVDQSSE